MLGLAKYNSQPMKMESRLNIAMKTAKAVGLQTREEALMCRV